MTSEMVLATTIAVGGLLVGLEGLRDMLNSKVGTMAHAIRGIHADGTVSDETRDWASRAPLTEEDFRPFATLEIPDEQPVGDQE